MKRNKHDNPVFEVPLRVEFERMDNTMAMREEIASGTFADGRAFSVCQVVGALVVTVEIEDKDSQQGSQTRYAINLRELVQAVINHHDQWKLVPAKERKAS